MYTLGESLVMDASGLASAPVAALDAILFDGLVPVDDLTLQITKLPVRQGSALAHLEFMCYIISPGQERG
jgi:hypothetical protein